VKSFVKICRKTECILSLLLSMLLPLILILSSCIELGPIKPIETIRIPVLIWPFDKEPFIQSNILTVYTDPKFRAYSSKFMLLSYRVESSHIGEKCWASISLIPYSEFYVGYPVYDNLIPQSGVLELKSWMKIEKQGSYIITAWAGPLQDPRRCYDVVYLTYSDDIIKTSKNADLFSELSANYQDNSTSVWVVAINEWRYEYVFRSLWGYNPNYKTILLSLPGVEFQGNSFVRTDKVYPALKIRATAKQIAVLRSLDFVAGMNPVNSVNECTWFEYFAYRLAYLVSTLNLHEKILWFGLPAYLTAVIALIIAIYKRKRRSKG